MSDETYIYGVGTGLPHWVLNAISSTAWERGHSAGQDEVDRIAVEMIDNFATYMKNQDNPHYQRKI